MNQLLVSICIPTYNGEKYIEEALHSAINQTYKNIEIIISDDDSQDNTLEIIQNVLGETKIPYHIYNHVPKGIGANWNNCIRKANGEYIKFLFQDDLLSTDCIEKMVALAVLDNKVGMVYCKRIILHDTNNPGHLQWIQNCGILHKYWKNINVKEGIIDGKEYLSDLNLLFKNENKFGEPTAVLLNKRVFKKIGYFDESLKQSLDIEYWYRVMKYFKVAFIDKELVSFRLHSQQATFINEKNKVDEKQALEKRIYNLIFWQLHPERRWKIFKSQSNFGNLVRFVKSIFR